MPLAAEICIAFLGIGLMGRPMAQRLIEAGYQVSVWNRDPAKLAGFTNCAARCEDAVAQADVVVSMLSDGAAVRAVIERSASSLRPGAVWVDMSSTRHDEALAFNDMLDAFVDAPVSGGVAGAAAGTLAIMAGGSVADYARVEPVLQVLGRPTMVGPAGSGQVAKLCNQLIVGATIQVVAEALLLAKSAGADPAAVRTAIRGGFAESRVLEVHGQRMLERNFEPGGRVKTQLKDLQNVLAAAGEAGLVLPVASLALQQFASIAGDMPDADHAAGLVALERLNPGKRLD